MATYNVEECQILNSKNERSINYDILIIGDNVRGKIIVIEGTDCSGKETQKNLILKRFQEDKLKAYAFPNYESPSGRIVGGPYLGKEHIGEGYFNEGAAFVDPLVASLYYAADRRYNLPEILEIINSGTSIVIDRYTYSNCAHHGAKLDSEEERLKFFEKMRTLEFNLLELPEPDLVIFLHMPYEQACILKKNREEKADQHESNAQHLIEAEKTYLQLAKTYNFKTVSCVQNNEIKPIMEIHEEVYSIIKNFLN